MIYSDWKPMPRVILLIIHKMCNTPDHTVNKMEPTSKNFKWSLWDTSPRENYNWPCWLQQPGKWTYNPMSKSATTEELWGDLFWILLMITDNQHADYTNLGNEFTIPCLSQPPHNHMHTYIANALHITYPMAYFKMAYQIHVQRPISRWSHSTVQ